MSTGSAAVDAKAWRLREGLSGEEAARRAAVAYKTWKRIENGEPVRALNVEKVRNLISETSQPDCADSVVEYWKQRALTAEAKLRKVADAIMGIEES